jgi:hypothetical protein
MPHYFYIYNISFDDSAVIQTARAEIYLFTTGTLYKIDSQTLVFAPSGQGFFHLNLPARSYSGGSLKELVRARLRDVALLLSSRERKWKLFRSFNQHSPDGLLWFLAK